MKFFVNYVKQFDTLVINWTNSIVNQTKTIDNITLLYNNEQIIGANIVNPDIDKSKTYYLEDVHLSAYAIETLKPYFDLKENEAQFIIAKVVECSPIEGTHLSLCKVFDGQNELQIVCGAKNVRQELLTVLATVGSFMPNGMQINPGKLKGHDSFGMLCSGKELNIGHIFDNQGIIEIEANDALIGKRIWEVI
ncbi:YtpR family tRNA-binding protein [Spiroplasma culicicola]|uniref:Putative tRNA-binding protein n=1 Tax=Spiroplasma culicicola AES-1 TaxID=1276246 RepID=W6A8M1_9MOLU|nr:hypothetical protein [Spiroplasma culicicola]AHI53235.1 putative tRNA-binding protein [Spiroplasma culicicola AES-1]